jgi:carbon-monoxide dehydrogenase medium subunit
MKAPAFQYIRAESCAHACTLLAEHGGDARLLAGGQSLMPMLNMRLASPAILIDLNPVKELAGIARDGEVLHIGAMTRHRDVAESALVRQRVGLIAEAMEHVAHAAIRNRGTFGGSIALADPAAEMPACCLALDGRMVIESRQGRRSIEANAFFRGIMETALEPDDVLVGVEFPPRDAAWHHSFVEICRRRGDYAIVGAAVTARVENREIVDSRLVFFGVGDRPVRTQHAEQALAAAAGLEAGIRAIEAALDQDIVPSSDHQATAEMRVHLAKVVARRALLRFQTLVMP